jgi:hypothetical protein
MQVNLIWKATEYDSLENCIVTITASEVIVNSVIVGFKENVIFRIDYTIKTNSNWETLFCELITQFGNTRQVISFQGDGKGNWLTAGILAIDFKGCIDVDIPLTPLTNTLPINRLKLKEQEEENIKVIYLDIMESGIRPVTQKYKRLSGQKYNYQNVPNDFEANISVDEKAFVIDYPRLFRRLHKLESNFVPWM